jgi:hypothetical protein
LAAFQIAYALQLPIDEVLSWPLPRLREWMAFGKILDRDYKEKVDGASDKR